MKLPGIARVLKSLHIDKPLLISLSIPKAKTSRPTTAMRACYEHQASAAVQQLCQHANINEDAFYSKQIEFHQNAMGS